jgi:hypothetical protein
LNDFVSEIEDIEFEEKKKPTNNKAATKNTKITTKK